jgi:multiple sugar transport system substrate-binding protein
MQFLANLSDEEFNTNIAKPVQQKYPYITMKLRRYVEKTDSISDWIASGDFPDMIYTGALNVNDFSDYNVLEDLNPYIKKNKMDMAQFVPSTIDMVRAYNKEGKMYALPLALSYWANYYNKDIFDKFGMPYPKNPMTWEEATELAKKLTRVEDGAQYKGIATAGYYRFTLSLLTSAFDFNTNKAAYTTDAFKRAIQTYVNIYTIPGNEQEGKAKFLEGKTAMRVDLDPMIATLGEANAKGVGVNWDMAPAPTPSWMKGFSDSDNSILMISSLSKNKDDAFKVLEFLLSKEQQIAMTKSGRLTVLSDPALRQFYGQNLEYLKGKNVSAAFVNKLAPLPINPIYKTTMQKYLNVAVDNITKGTQDINTALREAENESNKDIASQQK